MSSLYNNIVAYYKLQDTSDSTGNGYTLTNNGSVPFNAALIGNGADLGAGNTTKSLNRLDNLGITGGAVTLAGWVKLETEIAANAYRLIEHISATNNVGEYIDYEYNAGTRRLKFDRTRFGTATADVLYNVTLGTSNWNHVALTYNGTTVTAYFNGTLLSTVGSTGNGAAGASNHFTLGANLAGTSLLSGLIDEVGVWSRELTAAEVLSLYNGGVGFQYPFTVNLSLSAVVSSFTLTGIATALKRGLKLVASVGSLLLTGGIAILQGNRVWSDGTKSSTSWNSQSKS